MALGYPIYEKLKLMEPFFLRIKKKKKTIKWHILIVIFALLSNDFSASWQRECVYTYINQTYVHVKHEIK